MFISFLFTGLEPSHKSHQKIEYILQKDDASFTICIYTTNPSGSKAKAHASFYVNQFQQPNCKNGDLNCATKRAVELFKYQLLKGSFIKALSDHNALALFSLKKSERIEGDFNVQTREDPPYETRADIFYKNSKSKRKMGKAQTY